MLPLKPVYSKMFAMKWQWTSMTTLRIVRCAVIAALYSTLTIILKPISYGPIQFRISEALTILPLFFPEAIIGLSLGCFISNAFMYGPIDMVFGTLATLIAAILTRLSKKIWIGIFPPIIINAFAVPAILIFVGEKIGYWFTAATVLGGQAAVIISLGIPLYFALLPLAKKGVI